MTARKPKKAGTKRRRWPFVLIGLLCTLVVIVGVTTPRQLPAIIADQPAARIVYGWKEAVAAWVHRQMYPLSALRDDAPPRANSGTGYDGDDRRALDALIEEKTETKD